MTLLVLPPSVTPETAPTVQPQPLATAEDPDLICYLNGRFLPLAEARIGLLTHAFLYGTAVFEGIRGYWDPAAGGLNILRLREHLERLGKSAKILAFDGVPGVAALESLVLETVARNRFTGDIYIRPSFYKSSEVIGVRLHDLDWGLYVVALPFGDYLPLTGIRAITSSWRRVGDNAIPARAKITGAYANSAFARSEAAAAGVEEAIVLTESGHISEGSAENIFLVRDGVLLTPPVTDDILEGITRAGIMEIAAHLGIPVLERSLDRTELYVADEIMLCGTGAQIAPVVAVDGRTVGDGTVGPLVSAIRDRYNAAVRGADPIFAHWLTPAPTGH